MWNTRRIDPVADHTLHRCFSVTQAGKVKSQCPKVAPQEDKPKKLQGRAKKRIQYNKRFVNVVLVNGKRRACVPACPSATQSTQSASSSLITLVVPPQEPRTPWKDGLSSVSPCRSCTSTHKTGNPEGRRSWRGRTDPCLQVSLYGTHSLAVPPRNPSSTLPQQSRILESSD